MTPDSPPARRCPRCRSSLADDQEWCLECGASTTVVRAAPDWRLPLAIVALVVALAVVGYFLAVSSLS